MVIENFIEIENENENDWEDEDRCCHTDCYHHQRYAIDISPPGCPCAGIVVNCVALVSSESTEFRVDNDAVMVEVANLDTRQVSASVERFECLCV